MGTVFGRCLRGLAAADRDARLACAVAVAEPRRRDRRRFRLRLALGAEHRPAGLAARRASGWRPPRRCRSGGRAPLSACTAAYACRPRLPLPGRARPSRAWRWPRGRVPPSSTRSSRHLPACEESGNYDNVDEGRQLISTACTIVRALPHAGVGVDCRDANAAAGRRVADGHRRKSGRRARRVRSTT